jgi:hypothetical protein
MQPAPQPHQPLSQVGRDAHERILPPRARPVGRVRTPTGRIGRCAGESSLTSRRVWVPSPRSHARPEFRASRLVGLCYSRRWKSVSWSRSTGWLQVRQRPFQQRRTGCRSSTVCGSVSPAAALLGRAVRG